MLGQALSEPRARRAYILTKVGVFAAAAVVTVPLAHFLGPRAWGGLLVFGLILAAMTAVVLVAARAGVSDDGVSEVAEEPADDEPDPEGDPVVLPVEDSIDLHPFPPRDIPEVVESYLESAVVAGFHGVRLIHGRGIGVQRERVRKTLERHPAVISFQDASPDRGGWGATVVVLRGAPTE